MFYHRQLTTSINHSLDLDVSLSHYNCELADIVGMKVILTNNENTSVANPTLVLGIPSGLTIDHKQLKELMEDGLFDYFEIFENRLIIYYNYMSALGGKEIVLDLKAEIAGHYIAPPSSAYLYYDEDNVIWKKGAEINVNLKSEKSQ